MMPSIGEIAAAAGLRTSALRYYESVGLLPRATRVHGRRRYDPDVLERLRVIKLAKDLGFTLREIRTFVGGLREEPAPSPRWRALIERKLVEISSLVARAQAMKRILEQGLRCDCLTLTDCAFMTQSRRI
jgi:MerR family transcriptional regulator, redox-sensitive transcriptional activator SoxR